MAAILVYDSKSMESDRKDGKTLVWGRNHRGQLGIGTWDNQSVPVEVDRIHQENIRLVQIKWGSSFTFGITKNKKLYFSGKRKFWGKPNETININEMKQFEGIKEDIQSISVWDEKILARTKKGTMYNWGDYLDEDGKSKLSDNKILPMKFDKLDTLMKKVITGTYHSWAISFDDKLYTWGDFSLLGKKTLLDNEIFSKSRDLQENLNNLPMLDSSLDSVFKENSEHLLTIKQSKKIAKRQNTFNFDDEPDSNESLEDEEEESKDGNLRDSYDSDKHSKQKGMIKRDVIDAKTNAKKQKKHK